MHGKNDTSILFSSRHWTFVSLHCEGFKNPHICCRNRLSGLNNSHLFLTILEAGELQDQGASTSGFWQGSSCGLQLAVFLLFSRGEEKKLLSLPPLPRTRIASWEPRPMTSSNPNRPPEAPPPSHWGTGLRHINVRRHKHSVRIICFYDRSTQLPQERAHSLL